MSSLNGTTPEPWVHEILMKARTRGVRLWSENGQLHYRAPKGALRSDELARLKDARDQIVAALEQSGPTRPTKPGLAPIGTQSFIPATFSQKFHWNVSQLKNQPSLRSVACAVRLLGRLDRDVLQSCIDYLVSRHEALRLRMVVIDSQLQQRLTASASCPLETLDLRPFPEDRREGQAVHLIQQEILRPVDVTTDRLFEIKLYRLGDLDHVLLVAMEHMISDAFSRSILLRELLTTYARAVRGRDMDMSPVMLQFPDYALWQHSRTGRWVEEHGNYWRERLRDSQRTRFPLDTTVALTKRADWGGVPVRFDPELKRRLQDWSRARRTTLAMTVFTAYVAFVLRWCNVSDLVIQYQINGRDRSELQNTIGYLASVLYLRIELCRGDTFVALIERVTQEYCNAYKHADGYYLGAQSPRPHFTRNTCFNWVPSTPEGGVSEWDDVLLSRPFPFDIPTPEALEVDEEPCLLLFETEAEISGSIRYPLGRFSEKIMERCRDTFLLFVDRLLSEPDARVEDISFS
jgi:hypothetical protein